MDNTSIIFHNKGFIYDDTFRRYSSIRTMRKKERWHNECPYKIQVNDYILLSFSSIDERDSVFNRLMKIINK